MSNNKFVVKKITSLKDLQEGRATQIPESDITIQTESHIIQLKHQENDLAGSKIDIKPGSFSIEEGSFGTSLKSFELRKYDLLPSIDNTSVILNEADKFFNRLSVYKELEREPKRAILLCSIPGVGKTSAINEVCNNFLKSDSGTCVVVWDTTDVSSSAINKFFLKRSVFSPKVTRLILVIEDIGGGTSEDYFGPRGTDSSLLNLLDGVGNPFKGVPTFILATTNNPEQSVGALIDRPGRFDKVIELKTPSKKECEELLIFISKNKKTNDLKQAAELAAQNNFSIAHLQEIVVRSRLDDTSFLEVTKQLVEHKKKFQNAFQNTKKMGIGY